MNKHDINFLISKELKILRIQAGYTSYEKFAIEHELARKYYWMAESGNAKFTIEYLNRVLAIHNIVLSDFLKKIKY